MRMPYIAQDERAGARTAPETVGELTFQLCQVIDDYIVRAGGKDFALLGECLAALEAAKSDFTRRVVWPYEQKKQQLNGDVWSSEALA